VVDVGARFAGGPGGVFRGAESVERFVFVALFMVDDDT
jgi:hypothetical protein